MSHTNVPDVSLLVELPMGVIVEATGIPEASVRHALASIEHGKYIIMVN